MSRPTTDSNRKTKYDIYDIRPVFDLKMYMENETYLNEMFYKNLEDFLVHHSENIDVNQYNHDGQTALQQSCSAGNLPLVKLLVRFGANMRLTTREGFSVLHIAAFSGHSELLAFVMGQNGER